MEDEQGIPAIPPAARGFLDRHRPIGMSNSAERDDGEIDSGDDNDGADGQRDAEGESMVEAPEVDGNPVVADGEVPEVVPPPAQLFAPRPRAKGISHPPVTTRAMIEVHALEQHVNYAPWCPHCLQASALMRKHALVMGESPSVPTVSADFCFMKGRDADAGDGIPVLVMRDSQT